MEAGEGVKFTNELSSFFKKHPAKGNIVYEHRYY